MSNTYFKLTTVQKTKNPISFEEHTTNMELSLTAFMGGAKHTQLTVSTQSTIPSQSGIAYFTLSDDDVDNLIAGLLERKLKKITATGDEQSSYKPYEDEL